MDNVEREAGWKAPASGLGRGPLTAMERFEEEIRQRGTHQEIVREREEQMRKAEEKALRILQRQTADAEARNHRLGVLLAREEELERKRERIRIEREQRMKVTRDWQMRKQPTAVGTLGYPSAGGYPSVHTPPPAPAVPSPSVDGTPPLYAAQASWYASQHHFRSLQTCLSPLPPPMHTRLRTSLREHEHQHALAAQYQAQYSAEASQVGPAAPAYTVCVMLWTCCSRGGGNPHTFTVAMTKLSTHRAQHSRLYTPGTACTTSCEA